MMADRNNREQATDPRCVSPLDITPTQSNMNKQEYSLDLNRSPMQSSIRDSGYITDMSPNTTVSPATSKSPDHHFFLKDLNHSKVQEPQNMVSPLSYDTISLRLSPATDSHTDCLVSSEHTTGSKASVRVLKTSVTPNARMCKPGVSSRSVSESSDINPVQFDFEIDDDDDDDSEEICRESINKSRLSTSPPYSSLQFGHFDSQQTSHLNDFNIDDKDNKNAVYKYNDVASEPQTPRFKCRSQSLKQLKDYLSDNYVDDSFAGACGGFELSKTVCSNIDEFNQTNSDSFFESSHERSCFDGCTYLRTAPNQSLVDVTTNPHSNDSISCIEDPDPSLTGSQGFLPGYFDSDSKDNDSDIVLMCDTVGGEDLEDREKESQAVQGASPAVTILQVRSTDRFVSHPRRRRVGVAEYIPESRDCLPHLSSAFSAVSVSTQTPHATSVMIQKIIETPTRLPNQARGTVISRLHRVSESDVPFPLDPAPLPDIITSVGRDRSLSVPNLHAFANRQTAREVGQELRRLSDEFNFRRNLTPVHEEFDGHPASYPRRHSTHVRNTFTNLGTILRDTFRGRSNSHT